MTLLLEYWKQISDCPNHEISNCGNVRSRHTQKILAVHVSPAGYLAINLRGIEGRRTYRIHVLVAIAFIGPRQDKLEVNHKAPWKLNCRASNLEYVSRSENIRHASRHQLLHPLFRQRLTEHDILEILSQRGDSSHRRIAEKFGITVQYVGQILNGKASRSTLLLQR